jgi:hypothetical protein
MMAANDPEGWNRLVCNYCGTTKPHKLYISILIATDDGGPFPYSQTEMCKECWEEYGISAAMEHNAMCREIIVTEE